MGHKKNYRYLHHLRHLSHHRLSLWLSLSLIVSACLSCRNDASWDAEAHALMQRARDLDARHQQIDARIDSLWDATSQRLEAFLPPDFPAVDREIFLNSRNADHIRMFMSFEYLDIRAQQIVHAAGEADRHLSEEIRQLSEERRQFESDKMDFLKRLSRADQEASALYAEKLRSSAH